MRVYTESGMVPIKSWCMEPEKGALDQAVNLSMLPFLHKHVALMPDTHQGYGMPIGGVIALQNVVIPNAVGVDIGCGMFSIRTNLEHVNPDQLKMVMGLVREAIPVGFEHRKEALTIPPKPRGWSVVGIEYESAQHQMGTLGGGNHFIEFQEGDGSFWFMIHSGSRNLGKKVADEYNRSAKELNAKWWSVVPEKHDLAFIPKGDDLFDLYMTEMNYCVEFAQMNRAVMAQKIMVILTSILGASAEGVLDVPHNYASWDRYGDKNVIVHRKGAVRAREGDSVIIPGSQGTKSYIGQGKGNPDSFNSCSHGAGRRMGRGQAKRELNLAEQKDIMDRQGIVHGIRSEQDLDEAPGAYKDIDVVMEEQKDLVDISVKLSPVASIKA